MILQLWKGIFVAGWGYFISRMKGFSSDVHFKGSGTRASWFLEVRFLLIVTSLGGGPFMDKSGRGPDVGLARAGPHAKP